MIKTFTDVKAWQESHKLALQVYKLIKKLPKNEDFALTMQIKRAAVSVTSNIAEGYGRATAVDQKHFYIMASGSLYELKNQLILVKDLKYISETEFKEIAQQANIAHKILNGLIRAHKT
jgi:four helix bundle protein